MFDFFKLKPIAKKPHMLHEDLQNTILPTIDLQDAKHTHEWQEKMITYAPPRRDMNGFQQPNMPKTLEKALLGCTTILSECVLCHETKKEELLGSQDMQLDDILDKAEVYGPQYVARNSVTFVIQRYQAQTNNFALR